MAHTIRRLTMYALISSIEIDIRDIVLIHIAPLVFTTALLPEPVLKKAYERFNKDFPASSPEADDLLGYIDFGELLASLRTHAIFIDASTRQYLVRFQPAFESMIAIRNRVMHSRPLEYTDFSQVWELATELERTHRSLWASTRTTLRDLEKNPNYVTKLTIPEDANETTKVLHNLPQVEFDDTGFIGRDRELSDLRKALAGAYPVVTVVGEGGLGKTAVALKVCYEMLDSENTNYDAIVWTTAKTTKLTANEIEIIDNAITSSLGIIESAAATLGRQEGGSAVDDLILHLTHNRILLIIDNLETVVDQSIRELVRQVPTGSKILITTRIGLGAFDFPVGIHPMNKRESASYFRAAAGAWGVREMMTLQQNQVEIYCDRLQHNPLFIKSFMQSVKIGRRPSEIASDPKVLLQFCLQNVFNSLSIDARRVASALAVLNGAQSIASLAFFTELESLTVQASLSVLITSNLVTSERGRSSEDEDRYMLSALARLYIQKYLKPNLDEQKKLILKQNFLRSAQEEYQARIGTDIFDINYVYVRDKDDYIVASMLSRAIDLTFKGHLEQAERETERAESLSPTYFEVHRVRAFVAIHQEDFFSADAQFEAAISLAPKRAPLRLWYGGFLMRYLKDTERALEQLLEAERLDPSAPAVKLDCARALQYQRRFKEAEDRLQSIQNVEKLSARTRRVHLDLMLQNRLREAEFLAGREQFDDSLRCLEKARTIFETAATGLLDARTMENLNRSRRNLAPLRRAFEGLPQIQRLREFEDWLIETLFPTSPTDERAIQHAPTEKPRSETQVSDEQLSMIQFGKLTNLRENFGFAAVGTASFFFHKSAWIGKTEYSVDMENQPVSFALEKNDRGFRAVNVRLINDDRHTKSIGSVVNGVIARTQSTFGFISCKDIGDVFFHKSHCAALEKFESMVPGMQVQFTLARKDDGRSFASQVRRFSASRQ